MVALFSYFNLEYQTLCNEEIKWLTCRASYWELIVWSVVKKKISQSVNKLHGSRALTLKDFYFQGHLKFVVALQ